MNNENCPVDSSKLQTQVILLMVLVRGNSDHMRFKKRMKARLLGIPVRIRSITFDMKRHQPIKKMLHQIRKVQRDASGQRIAISFPFAIRGDFIETRDWDVCHSELQDLFNHPNVVSIASESDIFRGSYFPGNFDLDICRVSSALTFTTSVVILFSLGLSKSQIMFHFK